MGNPHTVVILDALTQNLQQNLIYCSNKVSVKFYCPLYWILVNYPQPTRGLSGALLSELNS